MNRPWWADVILAVLLLAQFLALFVAPVVFFGGLYIEAVQVFTGRGRRG